MVGAPATLLFALLAAQSGPPAGPDSIVWQAARAASGDSTASVEARWQSRLEGDASDPAARLGLAALAFYTYRYDDAVARYRALATSRASPDSWTVRARLGVGHVLHRRADLAAADSQYASAAFDARQLADSAALADALINLAMVRARTRGTDAALELFGAAAVVLPGANDRQRALHRCARGVTFGGLGGPPAVTEAELVQGTRIAVAAGEPSLAAVCVFGRAAMYMVQGVTDSITSLLDRAIELQRAANDRYGLAGVLQRRSWYQRAIGDYAEASATLAEALDHAAVSGNASVEAWASIELANIALALRDHLSAFDYADRAGLLFERQNDRWGLGAVSTIRAQLSRIAGAIDETRAFYETAAERQVAANDRLAAIGSLQALADIAMVVHEPDSAATLLASARALAESAGLTGWERGLRAHEARLALETGDAAAARAILEVLLNTPHQPPRYYELRVMHALASVLAGDLDAAEAEMLEAGNSLDAWRTSLDDRAMRIQAFQPQETSTGAAAVIAALAQDGRVEVALRLAEQRRARDLLDRMILARAMANDPATLPAPVRLPTLDAWRSMTAPDEALLYFVTGDGEPTTLLVVTADTVLTRTLPPIDSMAGPIERYRVVVESNADSRATAAALTRLIFDDVPAHPSLRGVSRLIIVPDGPLHRVPFASLVVDGDRRMIERFAVATAPSASIAIRLADRSGDEAPATLLALGDPVVADAVLESATPQWRPLVPEGVRLPRLAGARREVRQVARYAADAEVRTGEAASEAWLRSARLDRYDILHFATHAIVDEQSLTRSALVLTPGEGEDGFLSSGELGGLRLNADLVVLSACRSAGGVVLRGEGIHGLTAPLLAAGARAVVATQWRIEDESVGPLIDDFYAALADGLDAAEALQSAQRSSMARGEPAAVWAAFSLIGDPRVTLVLRDPGVIPVTWAAIILFAMIALTITWRMSRPDAPSSADELEHDGTHGA